MNDEKAKGYLGSYKDKITVTPAFSTEYEMNEYSAFVPGKGSIIISVRNNYDQRHQAESLLAEFLADCKCNRDDVEFYNGSVVGRDAKEMDSSSLSSLKENLRMLIEKATAKRENEK